MKTFTFSRLLRSSGEVLDEAQKGPVALTKRGKEKLIIVPAEQYHRLMGKLPTRSYRVDDMPADLAADLDAGLKAYLDDKDVQ